MIIGLYGKSGSGKTTACQFFSEKGFAIIHADEIGREVLAVGSVGLTALKKVFPETFFFQDGSLNRKKLGELVFSDKEALKKLNDITHPLIEKKITELLQLHENAVIDGAILQDTKLYELCDLKIHIQSAKCLDRIIIRDHLSREQAENRLHAQIIKANADIIIENNGNMQEFFDKLSQCIKR